MVLEVPMGKEANELESEVDVVVLVVWEANLKSGASIF